MNNKQKKDCLHNHARIIFKSTTTVLKLQEIKQMKKFKEVEERPPVTCLVGTEEKMELRKCKLQ
jgi:hypothetical protein